MRKVLVVALVSFLFLSVYGQTEITKIYDIQYVPDPSSDDASPLNGQVVTIQGVVSGESWAFGNRYYFVQDSIGPWSGIMVYDADRGANYGDIVRITGEVTEYYGLTEIKNVTSFEVIDDSTIKRPWYVLSRDGDTLLAPIDVTTGEIGTDGAMAEAYEGVLVRVKNAQITNPDAGWGEWEIDDGTGPCLVGAGGESRYYFDPSEYDSVKVMVGVMDYSWSARKIQPRLAYDIVEGGEYTRIQRIQQVRYSNLLKTPIDTYSDTSYMVGDTVKVRGIVTLPTGLCYAGAGIKFIFSEPEGGPWSAILSYHPDSTAYPQLFEGDLIEVEGYIGEYRTGGTSNMTEFWITSPIDIIDVGRELPPVDTVKTGDLRHPTTAEQWGNVIVAVKDAKVVDVNPQYGLFGVDDGTGIVLIDGQSDSLYGYPDPPLGSVFSSIKGWVYHHYGSYDESATYKTYKIEPLYVTDLVLSSGPPSIENVERNPEIPKSTDDVEVSANIYTNDEIEYAKVFFSVNGGDYQSVDMNLDEVSGKWIGTIPAQSNGSIVDYFIEAADTCGRVSFMPMDTSATRYGYVIRDEGLTIRDVQYSWWRIADSPFEGCDVTLTGVITTDTVMNNNYGAYAMQCGEDKYSGIFLFGVTELLSRGDSVRVTGTITDYNSDWHYKWDNNTVMLVLELEKLDKTSVPEPLVVQTGDLANPQDNPNTEAEAYEGVLVKVQNVTLTGINTYDITVDDGSGPCLVDADGVVPSDLTQNDIFYINQTEQYVVAWGETLRVGDVIGDVQGVLTYSFGTYKIELRDQNDFGNVVGVNENVPEYPITYKLHQNYPNPFNPETKIYFDIPEANHVSIIIYNIVGQKVRTLVRQKYMPGKYVVVWDGKDDYGRLVPSGAYFLRMKAGDYISVKKMMLLR